MNRFGEIACSLSVAAGHPGAKIEAHSSNDYPRWRPALTALTALLLSACGGSPIQPGPSPGPPVEPPANARPVIASIVAQGSGAGQPANFANVGESVTVSATVTDSETPPEQLEYHWSATVGTFSGSGRSVTWQAPPTATTPLAVTLTLRVVERYGTGGALQHEVTGTRALALHDSVRELGEMTRRFLAEFSKPQTNQDWQDVMRDFSAARCPDLRQVEAERDDVVRHYTNFVMHNYSIGPASVTVNFSTSCAFRNRPGDACVAVPVSWDSTDTRTNIRGQAVGIDHVAAAYSVADSRWWLCSSDFQGTGTLTNSFYSSR